MVFSTLFFALMNVLVKLVPRIPLYELILFRSLVSVVMSFAVIKKAKLDWRGNNKTLLILRGVSGSLSLWLYFITLREIPLASAVTFQYLSPIFSTLFAVFILSQPMQAYKWVFFVLSFGGIILIKGFDARVDTLMLLCGVGSAFLSGLSYNMIGKLKGHDDPRVIVLYFPLVTLPIFIVPALLQWVTPTWYELLILTGVGATTQLGQKYMTQAYQEENIGKVAIFQYVGIVYALLLGYFFFDEGFTVQSIAGMGLVVGGVILSIISGQIEKRRAA